MPDVCCNRCRGKDVAMKGILNNELYWKCSYCKTFFGAGDCDNSAHCDNCDNIYCYQCTPNRKFCENCGIDWCGRCENEEVWEDDGGEEDDGWLCSKCISH